MGLSVGFKAVDWASKKLKKNPIDVTDSASILGFDDIDYKDRISVNKRKGVII
jgi:hypothetical protein